MTEYTRKSFTVACSTDSSDDARARWEAVFGVRPERECEQDEATQTIHFFPCGCYLCASRCRICGAEANSIMGGRIVLVANGRCADHVGVRLKEGGR